MRDIFANTICKSAVCGLMALSLAASAPLMALAGPSDGKSSAQTTCGPGMNSGNNNGSAGQNAAGAQQAERAYTGSDSLLPGDGAYRTSNNKASSFSTAGVTAALNMGGGDSSARGAMAKGIDVSRWNKVTDWNAVRDAGISFAILATRSRQAVDPTFVDNANGAVKAGIRIGAYIYSTASSVAEAEAEADFVLNLIKDYPISFPVVYDAEDAETLGKLPKEEVARVCNAFLNKIRNAGYTPMLYANENWLNNKIDMSQVHTDVWVARYNDSYSYRAATMWQQSSSGAVNGITGAVDIDYLFKDYTAVIPANTWRNIGGEYHYYYQHAMQRNTWINDGSGYYYVNADGVPVHGWLDDRGSWYWLGTDGKMRTGWQKLGSNWFWMNGSGQMATGWINDGGTWYYADRQGIMQTGWLNLGGKKYYLQSSGAMASGWLDVDGGHRYFDSDGTLSNGWRAIDGVWYLMNSDGIMQTGWQEVSGTWYYLGTDGRMVTGLQTIGSAVYYLSDSGAMLKDQNFTVNGLWYAAASDGSCTQIPDPNAPAQPQPDGAGQVTEIGTAETSPQ